MSDDDKDRKWYRPNDGERNAVMRVKGKCVCSVIKWVVSSVLGNLFF